MLEIVSAVVVSRNKVCTGRELCTGVVGNETELTLPGNGSEVLMPRIASFLVSAT
jgi:hypothetical protein